MAASTKGRSDPSGRVLEKVDRKALLDDTLPIKATIVSQRAIQSHQVFIIRVQRGPNPDDHWDVNHRYSEFDAINATLQAYGYRFSLPPKTVFRNTGREFLAERQAGLQAFLDSILKQPCLMLSLPVRRFLDPDNYKEDFHGNALQSVSMCFRSNPDWSVVEPLKDIGWRIRKHYYLISNKANPKAPKQLLSLIVPGTDFNLDERDLENLLRILVDLRHPNVLSPSQATMYSSAGLCVAREFAPAGSLRDKIYNVPSARIMDTSYLMKYGHPSSRGGIDYHDIRRYGRHILDGMKYLLDRGFVLGHIHCGNVVLQEDVCKLIDLENSLMGIPPYYRQYLTELRKVQGHEAEAVYGFGHLLYEMACGRPLTTPTMEEPPPVRNDVISGILDSLLSTSGVKSLPAIADLLALDFFKDIASAIVSEKPFLKVPKTLKDTLRTVREKQELRLHDNQRKVAQFRRMSKAQESLMSTESKKERRKKIKKEMSLQESDGSGTAYPTTGKLKRQSTVGSTQITTSAPPPSSKTSTSSSSSSSTKIKTEPTKKSSAAGSTPAAPPTPKTPDTPTAPPPSRNNDKRGALLGSIEGFTKGKLKKAVTNDRSAPTI